MSIVHSLMRNLPPPDSYLVASSGNVETLKTDDTSVLAFLALTSGELPAGSPVTVI